MISSICKSIVSPLSQAKPREGAVDVFSSNTATLYLDFAGGIYGTQSLLEAEAELYKNPSLILSFNSNLYAVESS